MSSSQKSFHTYGTQFYSRTMNSTSASVSSTAIPDSTSYEGYTNDAFVEDDYHAPYKIPNCPNGSRSLNLYDYIDEWIETFLYSKTDKVMITIIFPIIVTVGLLANTAFLFTLVRVREMRTITNFYLANLALADFLFIIITAVNYFYKYTWSPEFQRGVLGLAQHDV